MEYTINLKIKCQEYLTKSVTQSLSGFIFNYNNQNYIITVHHFLPIKKVIETEINQELPILINSSWSELLVLDSKYTNLDTYHVFKRYQNKLPKPNDELTMKLNTKRYNLKVTGYDFLPYDNLDTKMTLPYIRASVTSDTEELAGLSGMPVFDNNKIVGVFSKAYSNNQTVFILPIYILIKTLEKRDNQHIYNISCIPKKINSYHVKDNGEIYHPTFKFDIPVASYLLIEGDIGVGFLIHNLLGETVYEKMLIDTKCNNTIDCDLISSNQFTYLITPRLLSLFKRLFNSKIIQYIFMLINKHELKTEDSKFWLTYNQGRFSII